MPLEEKDLSKATHDAPAKEKSVPEKNPPAKTEGQRLPDNKNWNPKAGQETGVLNENPPAKTMGQRMPDVVSEEPAEVDGAEWVAKKTFKHEYDGKVREFVTGVTRVNANDPALEGIEHLFEPVVEENK